MWNKPTHKELAELPHLYTTDHIPLMHKTVHFHFFIAGCDWFICEYDGHDLFFGFAIINNALDLAEWGLIPFRELDEVKLNGWLEVDRDLYWEKRPAIEVELIRKAHRWQIEPSPKHFGLYDYKDMEGGDGIHT